LGLGDSPILNQTASGGVPPILTIHRFLNKIGNRIGKKIGPKKRYLTTPIAGEVKEKAGSGIEPKISGLPNFTGKATQ
jgi:hypothetical protein